MNHITMLSQLAFVRSLELDEFWTLDSPSAAVVAGSLASFTSDESLTHDSPTAAVVAGSLASFTSELSTQQKHDVQNSTLLAQLAATKKFPDKRDVGDWYKFYYDVLANVGWDMQNFAFDKYKSHQVSFKLSEITLELLTALLGNDKQLLTVVKDTLNSFAKSSEGLTLFATNSASGQHGRFQILPCTVKNGQVSLASITAYFEASQVSNNYFFVTYRSQDITMHKSSQVLTLDEEVYGQVRQEVIDKLGKNAYTFVKNLQI